MFPFIQVPPFILIYFLTVKEFLSGGGTCLPTQLRMRQGQGSDSGKGRSSHTHKALYSVPGTAGGEEGFGLSQTLDAVLMHEASHKEAEWTLCWVLLSITTCRYFSSSGQFLHRDCSLFRLADKLLMLWEMA